MLNLYEESHIPKGLKKIEDVELHYEIIINSQSETIAKDKIIQKILYDVDKSKIIEDKLSTKFGKTSILNCSTGAKAVILAYLYRNSRTAVNITECGENAVTCLARLKCDTVAYIVYGICLGTEKYHIKLNGVDTTLPEATLEVLKYD